MLLFGLLALGACDLPAMIRGGVIVVTEGQERVSKEVMKVNQQTSLSLRKNQSVSVTVPTLLMAPPLHSGVSIENRRDHVEVKCRFKRQRLIASVSSQMLSSLGGGGDLYELNFVVDAGDELPFIWKMADVGIEGDADDFDEMEWKVGDGSRRNVPEGVNTALTLTSFAPLSLLGVVMAKTGCSGKNRTKVGWSVAFVVSFGAYLAFFPFFWRHMTFTEGLRFMVVAFPLLCVILGKALSGMGGSADADLKRD